MKLQFSDMARYLEASDIIDFGYREVADLAFEIMAYSEDDISYIRNAYEYVRDNISHSADIQGSTVTCKASEVLRAKEGICYAKSHLLAALLRCNKIPTGFCYQRLILDDDTAPFLIIHGLNAVYIENFNKWIRLDARGNKVGVNAQFLLEREQLAFPVRIEKGEEDILTIFAHSDENVINALTKNRNLEALWVNLPTKLYTTTVRKGESNKLLKEHWGNTD